MTFRPLLPLGGLAGWSLLNRTLERQQDAFANSLSQRNLAGQFEKRFGQIRTASDLVADRGVLRVVLGAFGLQDDLPNRAFIVQVVEGGVTERTALANRLSDKRYAAMASALAHLARGGSGQPPDTLAAQIVRDFHQRGFETAIGEQRQDYRLAMAIQREIPAIAAQFRTDQARWFGLLGNPPVRRVLETALGLPREFAALPLDQQVTRLQESALRRLGTDKVAALAEPAALSRLTQRFLALSEIGQTDQNFSVALNILQAGRAG